VGTGIGARGEAPRSSQKLHKRSNAALPEQTDELKIFFCLNCNLYQFRGSLWFLQRRKSFSRCSLNLLTKLGEGLVLILISTSIFQDVQCTTTSIITNSYGLSHGDIQGPLSRDKPGRPDLSIVTSSSIPNEHQRKRWNPADMYTDRIGSFLEISNIQCDI